MSLKQSLKNLLEEGGFTIVKESYCPDNLVVAEKEDKIWTMKLTDEGIKISGPFKKKEEPYG